MVRRRWEADLEIHFQFLDQFLDVQHSSQILQETHEVFEESARSFKSLVRKARKESEEQETHDVSLHLELVPCVFS